MPPMPFTKKDMLVAHLNDRDRHHKDMTEDERQFLLMAVCGETEKMENWICQHKTKNFQAHFWWKDDEEQDKPFRSTVFQLAFCMAMSAGEIRSMRCLAAKTGLDIETALPSEKASFLHVAVTDENPSIRTKIVKTLLELGADTEKRTIEGKTAGDIAAEMGFADTAQMLADIVRIKTAARQREQKERHNRHITALDRITGHIKRPKIG